MNQEIVFVSAKRTPFGSFGGSFKNLTATDLAVLASKAALDQSKIPLKYIDHVIMGNVLQTSADAAYLARHVALRTGLDTSVPAVTTNRLCGSGFEAIAEGARRLLLGEARAVLVGGSESMTQAPYVLRGARFGYRMSNAELEDSLMSGLYDSFPKMPMAMTAEKLAEIYKIDRSACDEFALASQIHAEKAFKEGLFAEELSPVTITERGTAKEVLKDEHIRPEATAEGLKKLKPVFKKDGVVTAGNASGMVDGACALVMTTKKLATELKLSILGTYLHSAVVGCDPSIMGIGPVEATRKVLSQTNTPLDELKLFELNEAFAAQALAVLKELPVKRTLVNVHGGAIGIGHPLAASGARLVAHLLYSMRRLGGGKAAASACIGGGQGMTVLIQV